MTLLSLGWLMAKWRRMRPRSLLYNSPQNHLLEEMVPLRRILVVGAGRMGESKIEAHLHSNSQYPLPAQMAGHTLANIFLDALTVDVERGRFIGQLPAV